MPCKGGMSCGVMGMNCGEANCAKPDNGGITEQGAQYSWIVKEDCRSFLFLLAWEEGSPMAGGEKTRVHFATDLLEEFIAGNEHILAVRIDVPHMTPNGLTEADIAQAYGYAEAFRDGYIQEDSVSVIVEWSETYPDPDKYISV